MSRSAGGEGETRAITTPGARNPGSTLWSPQEAACQEDRAKRQQHRESRLGDHERPKPAPCRARTRRGSAARRKSRGGAAPRREQRGRQAGEHAGRERGRQREGQDAAIHGNAREARDLRGHEADEERQRPIGQERSRGPGRRRDDETLDQELRAAIRPRPAPSAARTAISRPRASARASSRLATFAHPIARTRTTAPKSIQRAGRIAPAVSMARSEIRALTARLERLSSARRRRASGRAHLLLRSGGGDAVAQAHHHAEHIVAPPRRARSLEVYGHEELRLGFEATRPSACAEAGYVPVVYGDDGVVLALEREGPAEDRRVRAEPRGPEVPRERDDPLGPGASVVHAEPASQHRRHSQHREVVRRDARAVQRLRRARTGERGDGAVECRDVLEAARLSRAPRPIRRRGNAPELAEKSPRWSPRGRRSRVGSRKGSGSSTTAWRSEKIAVAAAMPRASVATAEAVKPGLRERERSA